jgi:hypothetical protein
MKNAILIISIMTLLLAKTEAQSPYKIDTATGGYLLDNNANPVRNDKNWDVSNPKFIDEFDSQTNTENKWNYLMERPYVAQSDDSATFIYYIIDDKDDGSSNSSYISLGINSPECISPFSVKNKKSHFFGQTSGITSCILRMKKENIQGWYYRFDTISCLSNSVGFRKQLTRPDWFKYTSGHLQSKFSYKYGWFEIKCRIKSPQPVKLDSFNGFGFNFWLYNSNENNYSEIDIFETDMSRGLLTSNMHLNRNSGKDFGPGSFHNRFDPNADKYDCQGVPFVFDKYINMFKFHTVSCEWLTNNITTFHNNERASQYIFRDSTIASPIYYNSMYIIMGFGSPYFCKSPIIKNSNHVLKDSTYDQIDYEIDYVKVYRLICTNTVDVIQATNTNYNFNNYSYGVKNNIAFGGTGCLAKVTNGMNVSLRAKTSLELKSGFEVEAGAEFYANICDCTN